MDLTKIEPEIVGTSGAPAADVYHEEVIRHIGRARDEQLRKFGVTLTGWVDFLNEGRKKGSPDCENAPGLGSTSDDRFFC